MPVPAVRGVFLSYASQDVEAAKRICESLRVAGVEVWLDQEGGLVGGDAWDAKIRGQISTCALFVPIISASTQARLEGYFRLEWKLAASRTHTMAEEKAFLLPVVIDGTRDAEARVPAEFRAVQWTRIGSADSSLAFCERVKVLLGGEVGARAASPAPRANADEPSALPKKSPRPWFAPAIISLTALVAVALWQPRKKSPAPLPTAAQPPSDLASAVGLAKADAKSVAVLAFANLSDDKANEYFSDGISEELLNVLAKVPGLKVTARTSAFHFKGKDTPIPEIAQQLGVAYVVEGSVRKAGNQVRITAQLIKAADGFHVWSDTFTRELKDVFAVQDEIAGLIAKNLSLKLGASSAAAKAAVNPQAYELYVQGRQAWNLRTPAGMDLAESLLTRALALEPNFARAHAALADVWSQRLLRTQIATETGDKSNSPEYARIAAKITEALTLDSDSAEAHASLGQLLLVDGKNSEAESALRRAVALNPNYASAHQWLGVALTRQAHMDEALKHLKLATELDPLSLIILANYGRELCHTGRYAEGIIAFDRALTFKSNDTFTLRLKTNALVELGRFTEAVALARSLPRDSTMTASNQLFVFARAGLKSEAEALLAEVRPADGTRWMVSALLALGRTEEALALLTVKKIGRGGADQYLWEPIFDPVRNDPRWVKFIADSGLTEAHTRAQAWRQAHPPEKPAAKK